MHMTTLTKRFAPLIIAAATTTSNAQVFRDGEWQGSDVQKGNPHSLTPETLHRAPVACSAVLPTFQRAVFVPASWPNNVIPYKFEPNLSLARRTAMINAMGELTRVADIKFIQQTTQVHFILIQDSDVNTSWIGVHGEGEQIVNITSWNFKYIMIHELMHAIGVWHEQAALDRDDFIFVQEIFIIPELLHNFDIAPVGIGQGQFYDYESVMHYGQYDFSILPGNPLFRTIITADPDFQEVIGQKEYISAQDEFGLELMLGDTPPTQWLHVDYVIPFPLFPFGIFEAPWLTIGQAIFQASPGDRIVNIAPRTDTASASPSSPLVINKFVVIEGAPLTIE